jgi:hypothetical protein
MSVGTAIFFSSLVLALVGLYAATKDRWRWRAFAKHGLVAIAGLVVVAGMFGLALYAWPLTQQTEYLHVKIGASPNEVNYIMGAPANVYGEMSNDPDMAGWQEVIEIQKIPKGKSFRDYTDWAWKRPNGHIDITFNPEKTAAVAIECYSSDKLGRCPAIEGIADGSSEDQVLKRFGQPDTSKITNSTKRVTYQKLGVFFLLEQQIVYMLGVNDLKWKHE